MAIKHPSKAKQSAADVAAAAAANIAANQKDPDFLKKETARSRRLALEALREAGLLQKDGKSSEDSGKRRT